MDILLAVIGLAMLLGAVVSLFSKIKNNDQELDDFFDSL